MTLPATLLTLVGLDWNQVERVVRWVLAKSQTALARFRNKTFCDAGPLASLIAVQTNLLAVLFLAQLAQFWRCLQLQWVKRLPLHGEHVMT
mgnify:CR=1 FL=1